MIVDTSLTLLPIFKAALAVSILIGLVLLIRRPVARIFGPHAAYALWLVPLLRLGMPPIPVTELPEPVAYVEPAEVSYLQQGATLEPAVFFAVPLVGESADVIVSADDQNTFWSTIDLSTIVSIFALIWFAGTIVSLAWVTIAHLLFVDRMWHTTIPASDVITGTTDKIRNQLGIKRKISVRVCPQNSGPFVSGFLRPIVVLPENFERLYSTQEQNVALTHELMHVKRFDLIAVAMMLFVSASQWFNPLAKRAVHAFRSDQEAACDAAVLKVTSMSRHAYAETLLKTIRNTPVSASALTLDHGLKERLRTMKKEKLLKGGTIVVSSLALLGLGATASYAVVQEQPPAAPAPTAEPTPEASPAPVAEPVPVEEPSPAPSAEDVQKVLNWERSEDAAMDELDRVEQELDRVMEQLDDAQAEVDASNQEEKQQRLQAVQERLAEVQARLAERQHRLRENQVRLQARRANAEIVREQAESGRRLAKVIQKQVHEAHKDGMAHAFAFSDGDHFTSEFIHGDEGMVILTDPLDGFAMTLEKLGNFEMPEINIPDIDIPMLTVIEVKTKDGKMVKIPEMILPHPDMDIKIEAYTDDIEKVIDDIDIEGRVTALLGEDFEKHVDASTNTIEKLRERCESHQAKSKKPVILTRKNPATGNSHKILCYNKDETKLASEELNKFVQKQKNLSPEEKERFEKARVGGPKVFRFSFETHSDREQETE